MSKHTPGPWHFVPWHIEEGQPAVRCAEGWIVATASTDADAEFIARAPAMEARIAEIEAQCESAHAAQRHAETELAQYMAWYAMAEHQHLQEEARAERAEAYAARMDALVTAARDLLAIIHRDGGHHCEMVGFETAAKDAARVVIEMRSALEHAEAELAAALVDAERYRELRRLATTWPTTALVVNYNIGHDWRTADAPNEIDSVVDAAIAARVHA